MANTPEGIVKQKVRGILDQYPRMYYDMPVPMGFGRATLDFIGFYNGLGFAIETKTEGKKPTLRQAQTIAKMKAAGAAVFVISGTVDLAYADLIGWLEHNRPTSHDHAHLPPVQGRHRTL
jgi:phosphoserine phosphatase